MKGFSLIEILLAMAIVGILAITAVPVFRTLLTENDLTISQMMLSQAARRAEANARAGAFDSDWGVRAAPKEAIVFKGTDFGSRDAAQDAIFSLPSSIKFPETFIVFSRFTALPSQSASLTLRASNGTARVWNVDSQGVVY